MATYYIDPSRSSNGDGSLETPYNTWTGITLTANNTYLQRRGTTYTGGTIRPLNQSSSSASPLTIGAYWDISTGLDDRSKPKPVVFYNGGSNGVGAVFVDGCTNVVVKDIVGSGAVGSYGGGMTCRYSQYVTFLRCEGFDNESGLSIYQNVASSTSTTTNITVDQCKFYNNRSAGINLIWGTVATAILKRITIKNCSIINNGSYKSNSGAYPCGGIMMWTLNKDKNNTDFRCYDIVVTNNTVRDNYGYGIAIERTGNETLVSTVSRNDVSGSGISRDTDSHSLWVGSCWGVEVEENFVHDNFAKEAFSTGSGVGIFVDYNLTATAPDPTGGSGCIVRRNVVFNQYKGTTQAVSPSAGIHILNNQNTIVEGNVVINCRQGIAVGPAETDNTRIRNNTFINIVENGLVNNPSGTTNTIVQNNVFWNASTGIFCATSGTTGFSESYNIFYNCTNNRTNGTLTAQTPTTQDATDQTIDPTPYMNKNGTLKNVSNNPFKTAGTKLPSSLMNGRVRADNLIVGAYQVGRV